MWIDTGMSEFTIVKVDWCPFMFRELLTCFSDVKSITFRTLELVHQIAGFTVSKDDDGIGQVGVKANE